MTSLQSDFFLLNDAPPKRLIQRFIIPALFDVTIPINFLPNSNTKENLQSLLDFLQELKNEATPLKDHFHFDICNLQELLNDNHDSLLDWISETAILYQLMVDENTRIDLIKQFQTIYEKRYYTSRSAFKFLEADSRSFSDLLKYAKTHIKIFTDELADNFSTYRIDHAETSHSESLHVENPIQHNSLPENVFDFIGDL